MLDPTQSVATIALDHSECAPVFQRHRIDFCCRGEQSLQAAALARGLDLSALLPELEAAIAARQAPAPADPRELSTPRLIAHIVRTHHAYLRENLPPIRLLASKVSRVHGEHNPKLRELAAVVDALADTLLPHLDEEEQRLFVALNASEPDRPELAQQLAAMRDDHLAVAELLSRVHAASDGFTLPDWACNSYRMLFRELQQLERDVLTHVHLENHVLAPRFAA